MEVTTFTKQIHNMNLFMPFIQIPTGTPNPSDGSQFDFSSPFDVIVYIILPLVIVVLFFLYRKQQKNDRK
jgi:hypothetical protein